MIWKRFQSLGFGIKLLVPGAAVWAIGLVLVTGISTRSSDSAQWTGLIGRSEILARALAGSLVQPLSSGDETSIESLIGQLLERDPDLSYAVVHGRDGRNLASTGAELAGDSDFDSSMATASRLVRRDVPGRPDLFEVAAPISLGAAQLGVVRIGYSTASLSAERLQRRVVAWSVALVVLALGVATQIWLLLRFAGPLDANARALEALASGDLRARLSFPWVDEVGRMAAAANQLAEALAETFETPRVDWPQLQAERQEAQRLAVVIEESSNPILTIDRALKITYANRAALDLLRRHESELRQVYSGFSVEGLVGRRLDELHADAPRQLLANASGFPCSGVVSVGALSFKIDATAIHDGDGSYWGISVGLTDLTAQVEARAELEVAFRDATQGTMERRVRSQDRDHPLKEVGASLNAMLDSLTVPVGEFEAVTAAVARGDLTRMMQGQFEGRFANLQTDLNASLTQLAEMVRGIRDASTNMDRGAGEIAVGTGQLSHRIEMQASSLEETSASVTELAETVAQTAESARHATRLAAEARAQAETGGAVVGRAVSAMAEINQSSKRISEIIGVIDQIAFQTNLLALNAAVEAARAGEQGRGFAVVAAEVRNLAQRSAAAAKEIKLLITESVDKVGEGSHLVDESGATLTTIVQSVKKVSDIIAEISAACQEQSEGFSQVNRAVTQMDEITQQNASSVEETAAAASTMAHQAKSLSGQVSFFKIGS